jgi:hypothetical protein
MEFQPQDSVVVSQKQLHGNSSVLLDGEVISVQGNSATVIFEGEEAPRTVALESMALKETVYGDTSRPGELPVLDQIRR